MRAGDAVPELVVAPGRPHGPLLGRVLPPLGSVLLEGGRLLGVGWVCVVVVGHDKIFNARPIDSGHQFPVQLAKIERPARVRAAPLLQPLGAGCHWSVCLSA